MQAVQSSLSAPEPELAALRPLLLSYVAAQPPAPPLPPPGAPAAGAAGPPPSLAAGQPRRSLLRLLNAWLLHAAHLGYVRHNLDVQVCTLLAALEQLAWQQCCASH